MEASIINFGNQPDLIGTSGVWHRWGASSRRFRWFQLYQVGVLTFDLNPTKRIVFFFWLGTFSAETEVCFFWSCMTRPYKKNMSDAAMQQHPWSLIEIWEYRDMFFLLRNDDIYLYLFIIDKSELATQLFVISNLYQQHGHIYLILYWYIIYSLSSIPVFQTRAYTYNFW